MKRKSSAIWQRAALMTIVGTTVYGTSFAQEAVLPKAAIPRLALPTQESRLESEVAHKAVADSIQLTSKQAINPNAVYADKRLVNPYTPYMWREDSKDGARLPVNFRTTHDHYKLGIEDVSPSRKGLAYTQMSGSGQPTEAQFKQLASTLRTKTDGPIYVVDLRQETHVFVNGIPISHYGKRNWGNVGEKQITILDKEKELLATLPQTTLQLATLNKEKEAINEQSIMVESVKTEAMVAKEQGLHYLRLATTDHIWPDEMSIDKFIAFYKTLPKNSWLHFHCEAGKGRTTIFMAMYDIMKNPNVPLEDILSRQQVLGGNNVAYTTDEDTWKAPYYEEKALMIRKFYRYVQQNHHTNFQLTWSEWLHPTAII
ncbi:protein tyrosine phosphatase [Veillonella intestinalis]|uniref:protein tyrosine phosphatase n=1 Tax=Veillonella intestinalis TaxID=2941341 RepID=UPI00203A9682|nr:protein tyrosine phosphatase [Veillonella intestinalis]